MTKLSVQVCDVDEKTSEDGDSQTHEKEDEDAWHEETGLSLLHPEVTQE